jgi:hypothetical protein
LLFKVEIKQGNFYIGKLQIEKKGQIEFLLPIFFLEVIVWFYSIELSKIYYKMGR